MSDVIPISITARIGAHLSSFQETTTRRVIQPAIAAIKGLTAPPHFTKYTITVAATGLLLACTIIKLIAKYLSGPNTPQEGQRPSAAAAKKPSTSTAPGARSGPSPTTATSARSGLDAATAPGMRSGLDAATAPGMRSGLDAATAPGMRSGPDAATALGMTGGPGAGSAAGEGSAARCRKALRPPGDWSPLMSALIDQLPAKGFDRFVIVQRGDNITLPWTTNEFLVFRDERNGNAPYVIVHQPDFKEASRIVAFREREGTLQQKEIGCGNDHIGLMLEDTCWQDVPLSAGQPDPTICKLDSTDICKFVFFNYLKDMMETSASGSGIVFPHLLGIGGNSLQSFLDSTANFAIFTGRISLDVVRKVQINGITCAVGLTLWAGVESNSPFLIVNDTDLAELRELPEDKWLEFYKVEGTPSATTLLPVGYTDEESLAFFMRLANGESGAIETLGGLNCTLLGEPLSEPPPIK